MSDLLSPIYVVFDGNEADAFWGLVGLMKIMVSSISMDLMRSVLTTGIELLARSEWDEAATFNLAAAHRSHGSGAVLTSW